MKRKKGLFRNLLRTIALPIGIFLVLIGVLIKGLDYFSNINEVQNLELLEQSVRRATVQCYAIEGMYPSELTYLEENYGIVYDKEKYGVEYGCFASNIMPTIVVYEK